MYLRVEIEMDGDTLHRLTYGPIEESDKINIRGSFAIEKDGRCVTLSTITSSVPIEDAVPLPRNLLRGFHQMFSASADDVEIFLGRAIKESEPFQLQAFLMRRGIKPHQPGYSKLWKNLPSRMRECGFLPKAKRPGTDPNPARFWYRKDKGDIA